MSNALVRPMRPEDVLVAERLSAEAFHDLDVEQYRPGAPVPELRSPTRAVAWRRRTQHLLRTDPGGCWVAEQDGEIVAFATSFRRDLLWGLATYAVRPGLQGAGLGRAILDAALTHARGCLRGMLSASDDPRAFRRYHQAGFVMHPQLVLSGRVPRDALPVVEHVREGTESDFAMMDSVDRARREAAHGVDHPLLAATFRLLVTDRHTGQGYAYVDDQGAPALVAATNRRTATGLLWECLAGSSPDTAISIPHVTAANDWAVDVAMTARLAATTSGYLGLRGLRPPMPYLHHGALL